MARSYALLLLAALPLTGCGPGDILAGEEASFLRADVTGAVQVRYEGSGEFWLGGDAAMGAPATFGINSSLGPAGGEALVSLWRQQEGRPQVGSYPLRLPDPAQARWESFAAVYHHRVGGETSSFVAETGTLRITRSSAERVEGTFQFTGSRYCTRSPEGGSWGSCTPTQSMMDSPRIEVSGSFVATPARYDAGGIRTPPSS
jgi:hypothetical protein